MSLIGASDGTATENMIMKWMKFYFVGMLFASPLVFALNLPSATEESPDAPVVRKWCEEVQKSVKGLKWDVDPCKDIHWQVLGHSVKGTPLVFADFGDARAENTTLVLATVHGDEVTPLYLALQLAHWIRAREGQFFKTRVVIAPLVNPDGFFAQPRTRMNAHGVDINRNFETQDWKNRALSSWKVKYKSDKRRFPGSEPNSEPETQFQLQLMARFKPQKILSVHSPLGYLDYDGPSKATKVTLKHFPSEYTKECEKLKRSLKAISSGFFPGSLGNYAGRELGIPTLTLELPSADPKFADQYWRKFTQGIQTMIQFVVPSVASGYLEKNKGG